MEIFESLIPVGIVLLCIAGVVALGAMAYLFITLTKSMKETFEKVDPLVGGLILGSKIPVNVVELFILFLERTIISLIIVCPVAHLLF